MGGGRGTKALVSFVLRKAEPTPRLRGEGRAESRAAGAAPVPTALWVRPTPRLGPFSGLLLHPSSRPALSLLLLDVNVGVGAGICSEAEGLAPKRSPTSPGPPTHPCFLRVFSANTLLSGKRPRHVLFLDLTREHIPRVSRGADGCRDSLNLLASPGSTVPAAATVGPPRSPVSPAQWASRWALLVSLPRETLEEGGKCAHGFAQPSVWHGGPGP